MFCGTVTLTEGFMHTKSTLYQLSGALSSSLVTLFLDMYVEANLGHLWEQWILIKGHQKKILPCLKNTGDKTVHFYTATVWLFPVLHQEENSDSCATVPLQVQCAADPTTLKLYKIRDILLRGFMNFLWFSVPYCCVVCWVLRTTPQIWSIYCASDTSAPNYTFIFH